ncbi:hypothetical protein [Sagittula salina]|uniref:Uncharacterized protein n=1 Tax=Sagittula salina TaxID=2820268 RepID=A0A940MQD1_9RHOB|nr:hypothetical protein [Sagittula salina]MBP0483037.1 hypothetical protein [Sagittula salina]
MRDQIDEPLVHFHRVHPTARVPMPADKAALGYLPISAYQYCEAVRTASAWGWYIFPPEDIQLSFDGYQTFVADDGGWRALSHKAFDTEALEPWEAHCPPEMSGTAPNFLTALSEPGVVQIWTGWFVNSAADWALSFRPLVNIAPRKDFSVFEAIVETDDFAPCPLFMNIQLRATDREILIPKEFPLFQVQPLPKAAYRATGPGCSLTTGTEDDAFDWQAAKSTLRIPGVSEVRKGPGQYAAGRRREAKRGGSE